MADLSALGQLQPVEPLELDAYADNKERPAFQLPKKGVYTLRAPESFPNIAGPGEKLQGPGFGRTSKGNLSARVDPIIIGPTNENFVVRFTSVSAAQFKRDGKTVSQLGDYLRAFGFRQKLNSEQEQADAVEGTANQVFQAELDWKASDYKTGFELKGMEKFPSDGNGGYLSWVEHPTLKEVDEAGNVVYDAQGVPVPRRFRANVYVERFIAAQ